MATQESRRDRWEPGVLGAIEGALTDGFDWLSANPRLVVATLAVVVIGGASAAAFYEVRASRSAAALEQLAMIEADYVQAAREGAASLEPVETANAELAEVAEQRAANARAALQEARQNALQALATLAEEQAGSLGASMAQIRAARIEMGEQEFAQAAERLEGAIAADGGTPALASLLRLRGTCLDELDQPAAAGEMYERAASIASYPGRYDAFVQAGGAFERAGELARAIAAYEAAVTVASDLSDTDRLSARIATLRARPKPTVVE